MDTIFYDGHCGLCHHTVKFVLAHDPDPGHFRFSPLEGAAFKQFHEAHSHMKVPDSIVLVTASGGIFLRSSAAWRILVGLGGVWKIFGRLLWIAPWPLRDLGYCIVAAIRKSIFRTPDASCPVVPENLRRRFDP